MAQIVGDPIQQSRGHLHLTDDRVAASAKHPSHSPRSVAVVDHKLPIRRQAKQAAPVLTSDHGLEGGRCEAVLSHEACSVVLGLRCLRVSAPPLPQPFVSALLVGLAVLAIPNARTGPAFVAFPTPIREVIFWLIGAAFPAYHAVSVARLRGMVLDSCCHADVLLAWANPTEVER